MSATPFYDKLEPRQKRFVDAYCITLNASEAARKAGYSAKTANVIGYENLTKPHIKAAVKERLAALEMGREEVRARIATLTQSDMSDFVTVAKKKTKFDLVQAKERGSLRQIKRLKLIDGAVESLELHDPLRALGILAQIHGLVNPKEEEHGSNPDNDIDLDWSDDTSPGQDPGA